MRRECGKRGAFSRAALPPSFPPLHRAANSAGVRSASTECGLDAAVLDRSSRPDEIQMHTVQISPEIHRLAGELSSVVHGDRPRRSGAGDDHIEHRGRLLSAKCRVSLLDYAIPSQSLQQTSATGRPSAAPGPEQPPDHLQPPGCPAAQNDQAPTEPEKAEWAGQLLAGISELHTLSLVLETEVLPATAVTQPFAGRSEQNRK